MTILFYSTLYISAISLCIYVLITKLNRSGSSTKNPPGPYKFPIIGNLHLVGQNPPKSFAKLSKIYGPLMSLKLGSKKMVIVSSSAIAREVLQKNDLVCSGRNVPTAAHALDHDKFSVTWFPVSGPWRYIRKLCKEQMFSSTRLDACEELRQEKIQELIQHVEKCSAEGVSMDIGAAAFITTMNLISKILVGTDFANFDSESSHELQEVVCGLMSIIGVPNLSDSFPLLRFIDPQGVMRSSKSYFGKMMDIFEGLINKRMQVRGALSDTNKNDLLDTLLDEHLKKGSELNINLLKHLLLDLFVASIDTTSSTVEWAMTELLRHPKEFEKAREELKQAIGENSIQESDISRLPYLQAIVKETFRLHPVAPLLAPHETIADVEISGYLVEKNTGILINAWALGRDEETWTQPEMFMPGRFLNSEIDVKGSHFELIPFGSGRRMCPGLPLAHRMVHLMLATFVNKTDWKLEAGLRPEDLDMGEKFGFVIQKVVPLKAIPVKL